MMTVYAGGYLWTSKYVVKKMARWMLFDPLFLLSDIIHQFQKVITTMMQKRTTMSFCLAWVIFQFRGKTFSLYIYLVDEEK